LRETAKAVCVHEAGIAHQVIDACADALGPYGSVRATKVAIRVGALASVDPDALRFCFDALKSDTPLATATLAIEWRSRYGCSCNVERPTSAADDRFVNRCPVCGAVESFADACALDISFIEFDEEASR
jgi:hydrogenase nickel incorporation protein HypA/HybF